MSNVSVNRCSIAHLTEQHSGQTNGCLMAFLARANVDATDRLKAGAVLTGEEREIMRMEIVKEVSIPY